MSQNLPDPDEDLLPGVGGFLGLPDVPDVVMKRLFGDLAREICHAVWPEFGPDSHKTWQARECSRCGQSACRLTRFCTAIHDGPWRPAVSD